MFVIFSHILTYTLTYVHILPYTPYMPIYLHTCPQMPTYSHLRLHTRTYAHRHPHMLHQQELGDSGDAYRLLLFSLSLLSPKFYLKAS